MNALVMAGFTFREAARKRVLLAAISLTLLFLVLFAVGTHFAVRDLDSSLRLLPSMRPVILAQLLLMGLWVVNFLSGLLAIFVAVGTIGGEIEAGTLHAVVPKPIRRWEIVAGKWLGFAAMLVVYTAVTAGAAIGVVYALSGYLPPAPLPGVVLLVVEALLLLSIAVLGSTVFSPLANGVLVFMLYALGIIGGMVEQVGFFLQNQIMLQIGVVVGLVIPSDVLWKLAAHALQPRLLTSLQAVGPFAVPNPPSAWMVAYAGLYALAALLGAVAIFERRDL